MKWESLRNRVARFVDGIFMESGNKTASGIDDRDAAIAACMSCLQKSTTDWQGEYDELREICHRRVMAWDVRMVGALRDAFPDAFPKRLKTGRLVAYMDDTADADWVVDVQS